MSIHTEYFIIANLDKREYIEPHSFNGGSKLAEFIGSDYLNALGWLVTDSSVPLEKARTRGRWCGDRIIMAGNWSDNDNAVQSKEYKHHYAEIHNDGYEDISADVVDELVSNEMLRPETREAIARKKPALWSIPGPLGDEIAKVNNEFLQDINGYITHQKTEARIGYVLNSFVKKYMEVAPHGRGLSYTADMSEAALIARIYVYRTEWPDGGDTRILKDKKLLTTLKFEPEDLILAPDEWIKKQQENINAPIK